MNTQISTPAPKFEVHPDATHMAEFHGHELAAGHKTAQDMFLANLDAAMMAFKHVETNSAPAQTPAGPATPTIALS